MFEIKDDVFMNDQGLFGSWWSDQEEVWIPFRVKNEISALRKKCTVQEGTTLRGILNIIKKSKCLKDFFKSYSHIPSIDDWLEILDRPIEKKEDYNYVKIGWFLDFYGSEKEFYFFPDICVIGKSEDLGIYDRFSFDCCFEHALDLPVKIIETPQIVQPDIDGQFFNYLGFKKSFNLIDIFDVIFYEVSFFGSPTDVKNFTESIALESELVKEEIEECEKLGKPSPLISWENLKKEMDDNYRKKIETPCKYCNKINNAIDKLEISDFDADSGEAKIVCINCNNEIKTIMFDPDYLPSQDEEYE